MLDERAVCLRELLPHGFDLRLHDGKPHVHEVREPRATHHQVCHALECNARIIHLQE